MTGLELSKAYYEAFGRSMIHNQFPEYEKYAAVGLIGEGSECLGFDDEVSEDHDFGPGFCIWLPEEIYKVVGTQMQKAYENLPKTFENKYRMETFEGKGRVGVFSINEFYKKYTGCSGTPQNNVEWMLIPETSLCTAVNGKVFEDPLGQFSVIRNELLNFYPKDIFLKKIVARMAVMSQAGQYNYGRCMKRGEFAAAYLACSEFIKAAVSAVYLLNRKYMPFYKWMFRGMINLENLRDVKEMSEQLILIPDVPENTLKKLELIEDICIKIREELNRQEIVRGTDNFLQNHCYEVMNSISDAKIRSLPVIYDCR
ncbi:DUF4037 domain-containing protein [Aminipila terrae]|uniref:DUF4037 domain-containing protein n=1 Tax=Aminipila terrae TaxID=2697030 RepID=A0A6P1MHY7_9FIRM|nr:DUF4037 domain-containing protein [Aminipila terrae]QHI73341.1 DUF4037 domain-containing protein [Aminipila terrae]